MSALNARRCSARGAGCARWEAAGLHQGPPRALALISVLRNALMSILRNASAVPWWGGDMPHPSLRTTLALIRAAHARVRAHARAHAARAHSQR